jgi:hypothetical protein
MRERERYLSRVISFEQIQELGKPITKSEFGLTFYSWLEREIL